MNTLEFVPHTWMPPNACTSHQHHSELSVTNLELDGISCLPSIASLSVGWESVLHQARIIRLARTFLVVPSLVNGVMCLFSLRAV